MKTSNKKQNRLQKAVKALIFLGVAAILVVFAVNDHNSLAQKYKIGTASFEDQSGYEVSYINLTGKQTIEDKSIKLSSGYWTSGKFNF